MLEIMQIYGWTFDEYESNPQWVLELAAEKLYIQKKLEKQAQDNAKKEIHG